MRNLLFALVAVLSTAAMAEPVTLIVDFKDDATVKDIRETEREIELRLKPSSKVSYEAWKITTVEVDSSRAEEMIEKIRSDWDIENVEVSQVYSVPTGDDVDQESFDSSTERADTNNGNFSTPNDPFYAKQKWHFDMIGLEKAWQSSKGDGVTVAILDTGVSDGRDKKHPRIGDLKDSCVLEGYNFVDDNDNPYDGHSHGTHVASSVAESTNNGVGGVGIAFKACILPVKVLSDRGSGYTQGIADGIRWATDQGADIINMSLGGGGHSKVLADAVKYAADRNVLVFCAAGNTGQAKIEYPAAYEGCLAISAVGPDAKLAHYSSYGDGGDGIFLASPGGNKRDFGDDGGVWQSTVNPNNPQEWVMAPFNGTSMATPIAAGAAASVVALVKQNNDGEYDAEEIEEILVETATDKGDAHKYGAGIVNVGAAIEKVNGKDRTTVYLGFAGSAIALFLVRRFLKKK